MLSLRERKNTTTNKSKETDKIQLVKIAKTGAFFAKPNGKDTP